MDEIQDRQDNLVDTTDSLEAVGVFKGWKNFLFVIVILCILLLQACFWLVKTGYVKTNGDTKGNTPAAAKGTEQIKAAAAKVTSEPNQPTETALQEPNEPAKAAAKQRPRWLIEIKFEHLRIVIKLVNFVLILTATLYCLTILFSLKVSLVGRFGGINHIARAFYLSLIMLVLLLPWQRFFAGTALGAIYSPEELRSACAAAKDYNIFYTCLHYLRFTGYWLLILLLLIFSQLRTMRWAKAILRRLEVI